MDSLIPGAESMTVEFKSDRSRLPDHNLVVAAMGMANAIGGSIYVGLEDDGRPTGLHVEHRRVEGVAAMIANQTSPSLIVMAVKLDVEGAEVARIDVPRSPAIISTNGLILRRRLSVSGEPENVPFPPDELARRLSESRVVDLSAQPLLQAAPDDLDATQRARIRNLIIRLGGDRSLLTLDDDELDSALGLVRTVGGRRTVTLAGALMLGTPEMLRDLVPSYEVAFQVLDGGAVRANEFYRAPLPEVFETMIKNFQARNDEDEFERNGIRIPVPNFSETAFREAFVNALVHRDYTRLGAVHVRWEREGITVSNPGGFVEGVTLDNLLTVEPRPRNPLLADIAKRLGIAERSGRGVDLIYSGLLRYGRPAPDYSRTDATSVVVTLPGGEADTALLQVILDEEERRGGAELHIDAVIALSQLRAQRRLAAKALAKAIQRDEQRAARVLEELLEAGLVEAIGRGQSRAYTLSASVYRRLGESVAYVRQAGIDSIQHEGMVLTYVRTNGKITRKLTGELCGLPSRQALSVLSRLVKERKLSRIGTAGRSIHYVAYHADTAH